MIEPLHLNKPSTSRQSRQSTSGLDETSAKESVVDSSSQKPETRSRSTVELDGITENVSVVELDPKTTDKPHKTLSELNKTAANKSVVESSPQKLEKSQQSMIELDETAPNESFVETSSETVEIEKAAEIVEIDETAETSVQIIDLIDEPNESLQHKVVMIPKLSPVMVKRILDKTECSMFENGQIHAFCFYCEKRLVMSGGDWKKHLLRHTGEMEYHCRRCRSQLPNRSDHGECNSDSVMNIFDGQTGAMNAFMCKWCHHVQFYKPRMMKHLESEHETIDANFNKNIEKIVFIPDLRPLGWSIEIHHKFVAESDRYVCTVPRCGYSFRKANDFSEHFHKKHRQLPWFTCPHCDESIENNQRGIIPNIMQHFGLHGSYFYECTSCRFLSVNDYGILNHIIRNHISGPIAYHFSMVRLSNKISSIFVIFANFLFIQIGTRPR